MATPLGNPPPSPPPRSSGMSTMLTVLVVLVVLAVLCCGICGGCFYFAAGKTTEVRDQVMNKVTNSAAVREKLGDGITADLPRNTQFNNGRVTIDFTIHGSKGTGDVHAEGVSGQNGFEGDVITVTTADGTKIDVNAADDPTDKSFDVDDLDPGMESSDEK